MEKRVLRNFASLPGDPPLLFSEGRRGMISVPEIGIGRGDLRSSSIIGIFSFGFQLFIHIKSPSLPKSKPPNRSEQQYLERFSCHTLNHLLPILSTK